MNDATARIIYSDITSNDELAAKSWAQIGGYRAVDAEVANHCRDGALEGIALDDESIRYLSLQQLTVAAALCTADIGLKRIWQECKRRRNELSAVESYADAPIPRAIRSLKFLVTTRRYQLRRARTTERVVRDMVESLGDIARETEQQLAVDSKLI